MVFYWLHVPAHKIGQQRSLFTPTIINVHLFMFGSDSKYQECGAEFHCSSLFEFLCTFSSSLSQYSKMYQFAWLMGSRAWVLTHWSLTRGTHSSRDFCPTRERPGRWKQLATLWSSKPDPVLPGLMDRLPVNHRSKCMFSSHSSFSLGFVKARDKKEESILPRYNTSQPRCSSSSVKHLFSSALEGFVIKLERTLCWRQMDGSVSNYKSIL